VPGIVQRKETEKMRHTLCLGILLLAGCHNTVGPFASRQPQRVDDPLLSISEQERRGRDRLPLPQDDPKVAPPGFVTRPGFTTEH
jgi:hypothetical protein